MNSSEHAAFLLSIKETQQRSARTLARVAATLEGVKTTLSDIQETHDNIDKIKNQYSNVMDKLALQIAQSLQTNNYSLARVEGKQYDHLPECVAEEVAVKKMLQYDDVLIITGAGVSAPSGIPTFRGKNGLYSKQFSFQGRLYDPEQFITHKFYSQHPEPIWEWVDEIYEMSCKSKPNSIHFAIDQLCQNMTARGKRVTLVTQNIDDLHIRSKGYQYFNIHGNVKYVRCDQMHLSDYSSFRKGKKQGDTKCPTCPSQLRPHVLFFDESYGELYGREVKDREWPFVMVIGSSLQTNLCKRFAVKAKEVIQVNPEPVIEIGQVYPFSEDSEKTLCKFVKLTKI